MRTSRLSLFSLLVGLAACSAPTSVGPPALVGPVAQPTIGADRGPCVGTKLDLDQLAVACTARESPRPAPPAEQLRIELSPKEITVRAGEPTTFAVRLTNVGAKPMALDVTLGCDAFEATAFLPGTDTVATEERGEGCAQFGGLCGTGAPVRVLLDPQGTLTKSVAFRAQVHRMELQGDQCVAHSAQSLAPGRYDLRVDLPFQDPVPGQPHVVTSRKAAGILVVTP